MKQLVKLFFLLSPVIFSNYVNAQRKNNDNNKAEVLKNANPKATQFDTTLINCFKDSLDHAKYLILKKTDFISGTVYFSGPGFSNVVMLHIDSVTKKEFKTYLGICIPGSKVTFDNVICRDSLGAISPSINKSLTFKYLN